MRDSDTPAQNFSSVFSYKTLRNPQVNFGFSILFFFFLFSFWVNPKMGIRIDGHIEKVNGKEVSYSEFVQKYMEKNQPVVLTGLMDDWKACKDWVLDNGKPNLQFFSTHFGKSRVQVLFIVQ
jgi:hypothetical protein